MADKDTRQADRDAELARQRAVRAAVDARTKDAKGNPRPLP